MSLHPSTGTRFFKTKNSVSVHSACPGIPCASLPSSFEYAVSYNIRYFGFFITCRYSISPPVSLFKTALIILIGNFRPASFRGDMFSCIILVHVNMDSWATVWVWLLVLCAGPSSRDVSAFYCLTSSSSISERRGCCTLGGFPTLFAPTTSAGNIRLGFTLGGGEGFSVPVGILGGVKGGTGGRKTMVVLNIIRDW